MEELKIKLDRERRIRFNGNSIAMLEEKLRRPDETFQEFLPRILGAFLDRESQTIINPGNQILRHVLWACLATEDGSLTVEQCGEWLTMEQTLEILEKCCLSMNEHFKRTERTESPLGAEATAGADSGASANTISASTVA